jgi:HTH-type transcriptional regulator / antitoxin HipB
MKTYTFDEVKDRIIGVIGTPKRDEFELELKFDLLGDMVKIARKERSLTQQEFGELIGVKKLEIVRIEKNASNVSIPTFFKVFKAIEAKVNFKVSLMDNEMSIS